jgi:tetratricopeptide (TPR) repeat protein
MLGDIYSEDQAYDKAAASYNRVIELAPFQDDIWADLADCYADMQQYDEAVKTILAAFDNIEKEAPLLFRLAAYEYLTGNQKNGLNLLQEALLFDHTQSEIFFVVAPELREVCEIQSLIIQYK